MNGIPTEEDRLKVISGVVLHWRLTDPVETNNVIVSFASVELDCKATRITCQIWEFTSEGHGGESHKDGGLDTFAAEKIGLIGLVTLVKLNMALLLW